jgi:hypothetical protein
MLLVFGLEFVENEGKGDLSFSQMMTCLWKLDTCQLWYHA